MAKCKECCGAGWLPPKNKTITSVPFVLCKCNTTSAAKWLYPKEKEDMKAVSES